MLLFETAGVERPLVEAAMGETLLDESVGGERPLVETAKGEETLLVEAV